MSDAAQLDYFKAKARRLEDERDQLRVDLAYEKSTTLMLRADNVELRKLVKSIHRYVHECQLGCEQYIDGNERCDESRDACWMVRKMRELGIEVDE